MHILYFDSVCRPYWIWLSRRLNTKKNKNHLSWLSCNIISVGKSQFIWTSYPPETKGIAFNDF